MDHLHLPSSLGRGGNGNWRLLGTKLLDNVHDGYERATTFDGYPTQRGFSTGRNLAAGNFTAEEKELAAALVQNWLFFGLIEEYFQTSISTDEFTETDKDGQLYLSTRALQQYAAERKDAAQALSEEEKRQVSARLQALFRECAQFFQLFLTRGVPSGRFPDGFLIYMEPLAALVETLQFWKGHLYGFEEGEPLPAAFGPESTEELVSAGWCRFTIANMLMPTASPGLVIYARHIRDHPPFIQADHSSCTATACTVMNVDTSTYKTQHRNGFCTDESTCPTIFPSLPLLEAALARGEVPVLKLSATPSSSNNNDDGGSLETATHLSSPYIAISHVWADGMGSTSEQGLPACQVSFLSDCATSAYNYLHSTALDSVPFWVDSISVPARQDLRHKAIVLMSESYARAAGVVVIDSMLLELSVQDPLHEQLFVLYISNWVQRMWTLQEAFLASNVLFRLKDGLVDFRTYFTNEAMDSYFMDPVAAGLMAWFGRLMFTPYARSLGMERPTSLDDIALHLAKRTSSRTSDEILSIAGLFGLDVRPYLGLGPDQRMARFLGEYNSGRVPADILFLDGERLPVQNFSWAPRSFLQRRLQLDLKGSYEGRWSVVTGEGLVGDSYFCLQIGEGWAEGRVPRDYRVRIGREEGDVLTVLFGWNVKEVVAAGDEGVIPHYDFLLLDREVEKGEELLAAACLVKATTSIPSNAGDGEEAVEVLCLDLVCYLHVFNDHRNEEWDKLPILNHLVPRPGNTVLIS